VPPPAAPAPAAAHSTEAADAAARAAAKQLRQLPSLSVVDAPVCVCPPGRDVDGLLGALSLNGSLVWGANRGVVGAGGRARVMVPARSSRRQADTTPQQQQQVSPIKSACSGPQQHTPLPAAAAAAVAAVSPCCTCSGVPLQLQYYSSELSLLQGFCAVVQALDPDVVVGWDIQQGSLGYLADRGLQLGFNVLRSASKTPEVSRRRRTPTGGGGKLGCCVRALHAVVGALSVDTRACCSSLHCGVVCAVRCTYTCPLLFAYVSCPLTVARVP
jgi:hypothetical protein